VIVASTTKQIRLIVFNSDAGLIVARARGLFAREGLDVEVTATPNSTDQMRGLGAGSWEIASTAFDNVLGWSGREGAEFAAIAQAAQGILLPVYVRPEIKTWKDLRGKPLAVDAVDTAYALVLRRILLAHGLDLNRGDYELVACGATGKRLDSMSRGETFAGVLNPPWDAKAAAAGHVRFADHREVLPNYPGGVYAVSRAWAASHQGELTAFLRAWLAGVGWAHDPSHREETIKLVAADQEMSPQAAAARLAQLPKEGLLDLGGLQSVLDLRLLFNFAPKLGGDLKRYYDLQYHVAARR
jgi:ABC-type nitrate/sulfonate/bicarbonate transport system substrate-binding protein